MKIPIFTSQLEKSREAVDISNARAAYAEIMTAALTNDTKCTDTDVTYNSSTKTWSEEVTLKQTQEGWTTDTTDIDIGGIGDIGTGTPTNGGKVTVSYNEEAGVTVAWE